MPALPVLPSSPMPRLVVSVCASQIPSARLIQPSMGKHPKEARSCRGSAALSMCHKSCCSPARGWRFNPRHLLVQVLGAPHLPSPLLARCSLGPETPYSFKSKNTPCSVKSKKHLMCAGLVLGPGLCGAWQASGPAQADPGRWQPHLPPALAASLGSGDPGLREDCCLPSLAHRHLRFSLRAGLPAQSLERRSLGPVQRSRLEPLLRCSAAACCVAALTCSSHGHRYLDSALDPDSETLNPRLTTWASQTTAASQKRRITLDKAELSPAALDAVLGFMYTERLDINTEDVEAVLQVLPSPRVAVPSPVLMLEPMHREWCAVDRCNRVSDGGLHRRPLLQPPWC